MLEQFDTHIRRLQELKDELNAKLVTKAKELDALHVKYDAKVVEVDDLQTRLDILIKELDRLRQELAGVHEELANKDKALDELTAIIVEKDHEIAAAYARRRPWWACILPKRV